MSELGPQDILIANFNSLGVAYKAAQTLPEGARLMEIFPLGSHGHAIFCSNKSLRSFAESLRSSFSKDIALLTHIPACAAKVLRAYLSVENAELGPSLLIAESPFLGPLMSLAQQAIQQGLEIVDLRMLRGASSSSYLFLTGASGDLTAFAGTVSPTDVTITVLDELNSELRHLFSLEPQSP